MSLHCAICKKELLNDTDTDSKSFAEIRRGWFRNPESENEGDNDPIICENIKFNRFLCQDCYLNDVDFCRFMNKIGCQVR